MSTLAVSTLSASDMLRALRGAGVVVIEVVIAPGPADDERASLIVRPIEPQGIELRCAGGPLAEIELDAPIRDAIFWQG